MLIYQFYFTACCGAPTPSTGLELEDQGCYTEILDDREFEFEANLTGLPNLTPDICMQQCNRSEFAYAALQV